MTQKTKVLIVDDHPVVREGLARRIARQEDMEVCCEAESAATAMDLIASCQPDLALVDLSLKDSSGLDLIRDAHVRFPRLLMLVVSMQDETLYAERALRAGARGYVMKHEATDNVVLAIHRVLDGGIYVSDRLAARLLQAMTTGKPAPGAGSVELLSNRELEVFQLIGQGLATRQIAERLGVSVKTVETYREHIKTKLHLENAAELARQAFVWTQAKVKT